MSLYKEIEQFGMKIRLVPIDKVKIAKTNVRTLRDQKVIKRLKQNIEELREEGLNLPLLNPPLATPNNEIFAGGYRLEAMKKAGEVYIPLRILDVSEDIQIILSLSEGMYSPLDSEDIYKAIKRLREIDSKKWTMKNIANHIGRTERDLYQHTSVFKIEKSFYDKLDAAPKSLSVHTKKSLHTIQSKLDLPSETEDKKAKMTQEKLIKWGAETQVDRIDDIKKRVTIGVPIDWNKELEMAKRKHAFESIELKIPKRTYTVLQAKCKEYNLDMDIFIWTAIEYLASKMKLEGWKKIYSEFEQEFWR